MSAVSSVPNPPNAIFWVLAFLVGGAVSGCIFGPLIFAVMRGRISWIVVVRAAVFFAFATGTSMRIFESYMLYGQAFREGWWPPVWGMAFALGFTEAVTWAYKHFQRRIDKTITAEAAAEEDETYWG